MNKIPQEAYDKAVGQFRLGLNPIMNCFRCYGMERDVDAASEEIVKLAEQFGMRVRGKSIPIKVRENPRPKPTD
uniref:Uncharacterized protein n=1 Tax=viral metagenome TaxID=1070528 RepID=A0A6M3KTN9_9ZZZZ